jgi:hypothetical protein
MISHDDEHDPDDNEFIPFDGHFIDIATATPTPPQWVIKDLVPVGLMFIAGPPKISHKSSQVIGGICATAAGYECSVYPKYMRNVELGGRTLLFSFEADAGVLNHMLTKGMLTKGLTDDGGIMVCTDPWLFRLDSSEGRKQLFYWLNAVKPRLCVFDPFRNAHQADENDSGAIFDMLQPLRRWAIENEAAVILVHHTNKLPANEKRDYKQMDLRGTGAMFGIADGLLIISPIDEKQHIVKLAATFKRGTSWERTLKLSIYDHRERVASEVLDAVTEQVYAAFAKAGVEDATECATQVPVTVSRIKAAIDTLLRNGMLVRKGKKLRAVK